VKTNKITKIQMNEKETAYIMLLINNKNVKE